MVPQGRFMSDIKVNFFMERIEAAQGSGGETIPGGIQKPCAHGTWGHRLVVRDL